MTTYEKSGALMAGTSLSGLSSVATLGGVASGAAMIVAGARMMVQPPGPEPGYHLTHDHHDLVGGGIMVGIGVAAIYATFRAVHLRDIL